MNVKMEKEKVIALLEDYMRKTDIFLVDVSVKPGSLVQVQVDRPGGISIDGCVEISRFLNRSLDRDEEDFSLEVSSPGAGTPFRVRRQYEIHRGSRVEVLMKDGSRAEGILQSVDGKGIVLDLDGESREIGFKEMKHTKSVISFK